MDDANFVLKNSTKRTIVLTFVGCYLPGFRAGGPIRSISNLVDRLGDELDFRIVTTDRDLGDVHPYPLVNVDAWNQVGKAKVFYASPSARSFIRIIKIIRSTPHDVLYLNSFFSPVFTLKPLLARRLKLVSSTQLVLAPRGEFSVGAFMLKYVKKVIYTKFVIWSGLIDNLKWHASTHFEATDIRRVIRGDFSYIEVAVNVASDLSSSLICRNIPTLQPEYSTNNESRTLNICFLSRISPMKNLDYALKVLSKTTALVKFDIYGPKELPSYWLQCEVLIAQLPPNVLVRYCGSVDNSQVCSVIAQYDLFFVPSRGENFGHVFMEALSAGVPILVSDCTPWRNLQTQKLGWDISLTEPDKFIQAIEEAATFDQQKRLEVKECCITFARQRSEDLEAIDMNRKLFKQPK